MILIKYIDSQIRKNVPILRPFYVGGAKSSNSFYVNSTALLLLINVYIHMSSLSRMEKRLYEGTYINGQIIAK